MWEARTPHVIDFEQRKDREEEAPSVYTLVELLPALANGRSDEHREGVTDWWFYAVADEHCGCVAPRNCCAPVKVKVILVTSLDAPITMHDKGYVYLVAHVDDRSASLYGTPQQISTKG